MRDEDDAKAVAGPHPQKTRTAGLRNMSLMYQYVNTPPLPVGVTGHKVAESVMRSVECNKLPNNGLSDNPTQAWPNSEPFPFNEISSNFSPSACLQMFKDFLKANQPKIDAAMNETWDHLTTTNSDVLTKGRQTWDPINCRSVPSAQAYREVIKLFDENCPDRRPTLLGFIQCFHDVLGLPTLTYRSKDLSESKINLKDPKTGVISQVVVTKTVVTTKTCKGEEVWSKIFGHATAFCAYLKGRERGKLERRAIASANMVLRAHLYIVEKFHLLLSQTLEGSVIGVGGEEKKNKIVQVLDSIQAYMGREAITAQATEDVTRYNECLAPECFALFHYVMTSPEYREELGLPVLGKEVANLNAIFRHTFYLLSKKKIWMGRGHIVHNEKEAAHMKWNKECIKMMDDVTKEWFDKTLPHMEEGYLKAPYGMLMGMLNAASTTMALAAVPWRLEEGTDCKTARSSDDSMTVFSSTSTLKLSSNINRLYHNLKLLGINMSTKKTRVFRTKFGELTSWYQDGDFTAQYGVETSSLRPPGNNPADDFHSIASQAATSMCVGNNNIFGAQARLGLGIDNCRRLWKIEKDTEKHPNVSGRVQVLADGGLSPWNWSTCHLPEIPLKERASETEEEKAYLLKVMNPDNPFTAAAGEHTTYSVELGTLTETQFDIPRNLFHSLKRSNRTQKSVLRREENEFKKACEEVTEIFEAVDPVSALLTPKTSAPMSESLVAQLTAERGALQSIQVEFTPEESEEIRLAISILQGMDVD